MPPKTLVILNPKSRGGRPGRARRRLEGLLRERLPEAELATTAGPRDGARLARDAATSGVKRIVVAGGDGSASEVASGLLAAGLAEAVELGFLPLGTGRDFARGLGVSTLRGALDSITAGVVRRVDAGRVQYREASGGSRVDFFVNVASVGLSAALVRNVGPASKARWGQMAFAGGFLRTLRHWGSSPLEVWVDGEPVAAGEFDLVGVANGNFFGGGMKLAPAARFDDGLLDLVVVRAMSKAQWLRRMPFVYGGHHLRFSEVIAHRAQEIDVCFSGPPEHAPLLELDGEAGGAAPVRFSVLPAALRVLAPPPGALS